MILLLCAEVGVRKDIFGEKQIISLVELKEYLEKFSAKICKVSNPTAVTFGVKNLYEKGETTAERRIEHNPDLTHHKGKKTKLLACKT